jgi:uncharacterized Zn finger protein (UPF0148 family)
MTDRQCSVCGAKALDAVGVRFCGWCGAVLPVADKPEPETNTVQLSLAASRPIK